MRLGVSTGGKKCTAVGGTNPDDGVGAGSKAKRRILPSAVLGIHVTSFATNRYPSFKGSKRADSWLSGKRAGRMLSSRIFLLPSTDQMRTDQPLSSCASIASVFPSEAT